MILNIAYIKAKYDSTEKALEMYFVVLFLDILGYTNETICNNNGVINITSYTNILNYLLLHLQL